MENIVTTAVILANKAKSGECFYLHNSLIICGENGYGKTTLIHEMIEALKPDKSYEFYYIDLHNRMIYDPENTAGKNIDFMNLRDIVDNRTKEVNFTVKDVFDDMSPGAAVVYNTIVNNYEYYKDLFEENLDITLNKGNEENLYGTSQLYINGDGELYRLASSESARMRILFEVEYAVSLGAKTIFIDEFDVCLSDDTAATFLAMLSKKYEKVSFVVSMQHLTSLITLAGFDGALICDVHSANTEDNMVRLFDVDNINELGQIDKLKRLFDTVTRTSMLEEIVSRIVDTKEKRDADVTFLHGLNRDLLTGREKILYDYANEVISQ